MKLAEQARVPASLQALIAQADTPLLHWCLVAIAIIAVWVWLIEPVHMWKEELELQVARTGDRVARMHAMETNADKWIEARAEVRRALRQTEDQLLSGASDTQAQAALQGFLQNMVSARGLAVESQKLNSPEIVEGIGSRLAIELSVRGELIDLIRLLDDVSNAQQLIYIDQWSIQVQRDKSAFARVTLAGFRPADSVGKDE